MWQAEKLKLIVHWMCFLLLFGRYKRSLLGGKIKGSDICSCAIRGYHGWLGQSGTIKNPSALSKYTFCNFFEIMLKGGNA